MLGCWGVMRVFVVQSSARVSAVLVVVVFFTNGDKGKKAKADDTVGIVD